MSGKGFLGNMTENLQADCVQSRQAGFIQRFLSITHQIVTVKAEISPTILQTKQEMRFYFSFF
ncbi:hypothetical protein [Ruminococcus sp.]